MTAGLLSWNNHFFVIHIPLTICSFCQFRFAKDRVKTIFSFQKLRYLLKNNKCCLINFKSHEIIINFRIDCVLKFFSSWWYIVLVWYFFNYFILIFKLSLSKM